MSANLVNLYNNPNPRLAPLRAVPFFLSALSPPFASLPLCPSPRRMPPKLSPSSPLSLSDLTGILTALTDVPHGADGYRSVRGSLGEGAG